jgi:hypothetical protein
MKIIFYLESSKWSMKHNSTAMRTSQCTGNNYLHVKMKIIFHLESSKWGIKHSSTAMRTSPTRKVRGEIRRSG